MKNSIVRIIQFFAVSFVVLLLCTKVTWAASSDISADSVLQAVNAVRVQQGHQPISMNEKLVRAAQAKAENMITYGYWAHTNPTTNETGWKFIQQEGYHYLTAGENLAKDYTTVSGVITGWMNSSTHKSILLSDMYSQTGIGVIHYTVNGKDEALIVELFAKPAPLSFLFYK